MAGAVPAARRRRRRSRAPLPPAATSFSANGATITADIASNALVIMAPEPVYNNLRAIIEKLDVRRAQVFVEALIVEVSADKAAEFGIQWQALSGYNSTQTRVIGGTNFTPRGSGNNIIDVAVNPGSVGQGLALGVMKGTVTIPGLGTITNLAFLARALETQVGANILSTPTLLTLDNEEARIIVGQNIPLITGSYATTGGTNTVTPFQTFERKDVGIVLRVKPQITEGGTIRLAIYQEVSRVEDVTTQGGVDPVEARARIDGGRRRHADHRAGRPHRGPADRRQRQGPVVRRHPDRGRALPLRCAPAAEDEPDDLHQADGVAHERRRTRAHVGALPVPAGRAGAADAAQPASSGAIPAQPTLPPQGVSPGTPGADPTPPLLGDKPTAPPACDPGRAAREALSAPRRSRWPPSTHRAAAGFAHRIPYAFARAHGVLAQAEERDGDRRADATRRHRRRSRGAEARAAASARSRVPSMPSASPRSSRARTTSRAAWRR